MWEVYLLQCADGSYYCGISTDVERRVREHNEVQRKASAYCWAHRPVRLVWRMRHDNKSKAAKAEARIKKYAHQHKERLLKGVCPHCKRPSQQHTTAEWEDHQALAGFQKTADELGTYEERRTTRLKAKAQ